MSFIKRVAVITGFLSLFLGFFLGSLCPPGILPWEEVGPAVPPTVNVIVPSTNATSADNSNAGSKDQPAFNPKDNVPLVSSAYAVARAIQTRDYKTLSAYVHPDLGVTFTPYSTVDPETDLRFTAAQVREFQTDHTVYTWGYVDGRGSLIQMTPEEFFSSYVANADYTQAPKLGIDQILHSGNALENLTQVYQEGRFVEFHYPSLDQANDGLDWCSLKLAFYPSETCWYLVGIIHSQWTI